MLKLKKDDATFKVLNEKAKKNNQSLKEYLLDEKNENEVCDVFYPAMPKLVRMAMSKDKFKVFYSTNKQMFVANIGG